MTDSEEKPERECPWKGIAVREIAKHRITPGLKRFSIENQTGHYMCSICRSPNKTCPYSPDTPTKEPEPTGAI